MNEEIINYKHFSWLAFSSLSLSLRRSIIKRPAWGRLLPLPQPLNSGGHACPASPQCLASSEHTPPALVEEAGRRVLQSRVAFSARLRRSGVWVFVSGRKVMTVLQLSSPWYMVFVHEGHHNLDSLPAKWPFHLWQSVNYRSQQRLLDISLVRRWSASVICFCSIDNNQSTGTCMYGRCCAESKSNIKYVFCCFVLLIWRLIESVFSKEFISCLRKESPVSVLRGGRFSVTVSFVL